MSYRVVLLDAGGTIIGPRDSFGAVYRRVFRFLGVDLPEDRLEAGIRDTWSAMTAEVPRGIDRYAHYEGGEEEFWLRFSRRAVEQAGGRPIDDGLARRGLALLREAFSQPAAWQVYPDVFPALEELKRDGVRVGVVSNWDSRLPEILRMLGLAGYLDDIGVSHLEGVEKPDPELFRRVLRRMGADPRETVHVGDTPELDVAGARTAGIDGLLVDRYGRMGHEALPDLGPLPAIARG